MARNKRKSGRELFAENHIPVKEKADNKKGYKIVYRYVGKWSRWESERWSIRTCKFLFAVLEAVSLIIYISAALVDTGVNVVPLANGFGAVSWIPWIMELSGIVRFMIAGDYVHEQTCDEIDQSVRGGTVLRAVLVFLSAALGLMSAISSKAVSATDYVVCICICISASLSLVVWRLFAGLNVDIYRNEGGKPGNKY